MNGMNSKQKSIRKKILEASIAGNRGHLGGAFSCVDILLSLFDNGVMKNEDDFVLSKGHSAVALYAILYDDISKFCKDGSIFTEHPSILLDKIRITTGSLGHGIGIAIGMALAKKMNKLPGRVYVLLGDGECMEGSVYEALLFAGKKRLNNLTIIIDNNGLMSTDILPINIKPETIFKGMGTSIETVDGHDLHRLYQVLSKTSTVPRLIVAKTVKGKGVSFMENNIKWHNGIPTGDKLEIAMKELS